MKGNLVAAAGILAVSLTGCGGGGWDSSTTSTASGSSVAPSSFAITAKVDGTAVSGLSVAPGGSGTINLASNQQLEFDSDSGVSWTPNVGTTKEISQSSASGVYKTTLFTPVDSTVTYTVASLNDPSKTATITVNVTGQRFAPSVTKVGNYVTYAANRTNVDGSSLQSVYTNKVLSMNADGSYVAGQFDGNNVQTYTANYLANGTEVSFQPTGSSSAPCVYTPSQALLVYPLYVGQTFSTSNTYQCGSGSGAYQESEVINGTVLAYEPVTVTAGTFNTLKIERTTTVSNSTDANLAASPTKGYTITETVWLDTVSMRNVKSSSTRTYSNTVPGTYQSFQATELTAHLKQ